MTESPKPSPGEERSLKDKLNDVAGRYQTDRNFRDLFNKNIDSQREALRSISFSDAEIDDLLGIFTRGKTAKSVESTLRTGLTFVQINDLLSKLEPSKGNEKKPTP